MKKSQIFAILWMIGFPLVVMLGVSQFVRSESEASSGLTREVAITASKTCSYDRIQRLTKEVLATATRGSTSVRIDCDLNLPSGSLVTKKLIFEGSDATGVTLNCNGATVNREGTPNNSKAMIEVRSRSYVKDGERYWDRPQNVTIKNCNIIGAVRVWGMAWNGEGYEYKDDGVKVNHFKNSSREAGHARRARSRAPTNIVFDNMIITGKDLTPVYFAPGVTGSKLINSEIKGKSDGVAVYLDAESYRNTIKGNSIHVVTKNRIFEEWDWPLIAIDGSSHNRIVNNEFSALNHGGIYLYRNCGQGGVIRHSTPRYNRIINNIFYYDKYGTRDVVVPLLQLRLPRTPKGGNPAVYLGSRGNIEHSGHCRKDDGYDFGSSKSDLDYASDNIVMQNQIYKRSVSDMIVVGKPKGNTNNHIRHNRTVDENTVENDRPAGCYIPRGYEKDFILHGESMDVYKDRKGEPLCGDYVRCNNGDLSPQTASDCEIVKHPFSFLVTDDNGGVRKTVTCPSGRRIIGAKVACNLEYGEISNSQLETVPMNNIKVVRASDARSRSRSNCFIHRTSLKIDQKEISGIGGRNWVNVGCSEHDRNGGDCHIKGVLYCR